jgi:four helix bundle protein
MTLRYRNFKVYQDAIELHQLIVKITKEFPKEFDYLKNQIRRAALSVILNIAEGSAKNSDKDFNRYLGNSLGSIDETMAGCEVALKENLISQEIFNKIEKKAVNIGNQLGGFSKRLKNSK